MTHRIYVEIDNLKPLIDWLKTKPEGECKVLIGGTKDVAPVMKAIQKEGRTFGAWVLKKIQAGELKVSGTMERLDLPIGEVVSD